MLQVQAFSCPYCNYRGVEKPKVRMHVMVHHPAAPLVVLKNIRMLQKYYDVVRGLFKEVLLDKGMLRRYTPAGENAIDYGYDPNDDSVRPTLEEEEEEEEVNVEYVEQADDFDPAQVDTRRILEQSLKLSRAQGKNVKSFLPAKKVIGVKKSAASKSAASMSFNMSQIKNAIKVGGPPRPRPKKSKGSSVSIVYPMKCAHCFVGGQDKMNGLFCSLIHLSIHPSHFEVSTHFLTNRPVAMPTIRPLM